MTHPRDMGAKQVEAFLTMLATERKVSASTHNQALSALLFLYREVLEEDLPWLTDINRSAATRFEADPAAGKHCQAGIATYLAPQLRHTFAAIRHRHSHGARAAGPQ